MPLRNAIVGSLGHPEEPFDWAQHPRRINLGAGYDRRAGYLNVDLQSFHDPDLVGDVRSLPRLPSGRYEEIVAQDVLEHLTRGDGPVALREWRRLLVPNGRLWLRVPDLLSLMTWLRESEDPERHRQVMHFLFGTQAYTGDFHLSGYTDLLLCDELRRAGFDGIELERRDNWLWEGEAFAAAANAKRPVAIVWGPGFHAREMVNAETSWRWAAPDARLLLHTDESRAIDLALVMRAGGAHVSGAGVDTLLEPGEHVLHLELAAGANRLVFASGAIEVPGDARSLGFQLGGAVEVGLAIDAERSL
jgi:hypothetical protein